MPVLLLQKPIYKSNAKQHKECLMRRFTKWENGDFNELLIEGRTIQSKLRNVSKRTEDDIAKTFAKHILRGNVNAALRLLDKQQVGGVLNLTEEVLNQLQEKHPTSVQACPAALLEGDLPFTDPILFEGIDETTISKEY